MSLLSNVTETVLDSIPLCVGSWALAVTSNLETTSTSAWAITALAVVSVVRWLRRPWTDKNAHNIPHGPVGLPIIGERIFSTWENMLC